MSKFYVNVEYKSIIGKVEKYEDNEWFISASDIEEGKYKDELTEDSREELWNEYGLSRETLDKMLSFAEQHGKATIHVVRNLVNAWTGRFHVDAWITIER